MNIIFDGNYLYHKTFSIFSTYYKGQDMGEVLSEPDKQQILLRKCIIDMCATLQRFKDIKTVTVVIDSHSWRYSLHDDYKYALTRVRDPWYKYFLTVLDMFEDLLRKKGVIVSRVKGAEGDDLLYFWSLYFGTILEEEVVIVTGDSDIRQIIEPNIALFNNNSKKLEIHCHPSKEIFWNAYMSDDVLVHPINAFFVLLDKVIRGDRNDNIPTLKKGIGAVASQKFMDTIYKQDIPPNGVDFVSVARWIATRFAEFVKANESDYLEQVLFNLKMVWLNLSVYNEIDYQTDNGKSLIENILSDVANHKDSYSYNKPYTLEEFYGFLIK